MWRTRGVAEVVRFFNKTSQLERSHRPTCHGILLGRRGDPGAQYPGILPSVVQKPGVSLSLHPRLERWGRGTQHTTAEVWRFVGVFVPWDWCFDKESWCFPSAGRSGQTTYGYKDPNRWTTTVELPNKLTSYHWLMFNGCHHRVTPIGPSMVTGVGHRSTVVYRAWMPSSWVRWVTSHFVVAGGINGNESHPTLQCCCSMFYIRFAGVFFWGWGATNFPGEVPLLERVHVRQDCHCKCAAEYIQMSLITGRAPCQTDQQWSGDYFLVGVAT